MDKGKQHQWDTRGCSIVYNYVVPGFLYNWVKEGGSHKMEQLNLGKSLLLFYFFNFNYWAGILDFWVNVK